MQLKDILMAHKSYNGMDLVGFLEVALPVYQISSRVLVHEKVALPTIQEFALRAVNMGFRDLENIKGLLGISETIAKAALSSLIQDGLIYETSVSVRPSPIDQRTPIIR